MERWLVTKAIAVEEFNLSPSWLLDHWRGVIIATIQYYPNPIDLIQNGPLRLQKETKKSNDNPSSHGLFGPEFYFMTLPYNAP